MATYLVRRLALMIPTFLGITVVTFVLMHLAPGDPVSLGMGEAGMRSTAVSREAILHLRKTMGLDLPLYEQYWLWLTRIVRLDFGESFISGRPIAEILRSAVPVTLVLSGISIFLSYLIAIPLGIYSSVKQDTLGDRISTVTLFVLYSLPSFWVALMLILFLCSGHFLQLFPMLYFSSEGAENLSTWAYVKDVAWHITLPVVCLTYASLASLSRYMRSGMLEAIRQDYVRTARAKGLSELVVILKHTLRNSLIPVVTLLGLVLPHLIGGSVIVERIFGIQGMGYWAFTAILQRDYNLVMAEVTLAALLTMAGLLLSDVLYAWVDPRIHYGAKK